MVASHTLAFEEARVSAVEAASRFLDNGAGVIDTARTLCALRSVLVGDALSDAWRTFVAIDSETDHLPVGAERLNWAAGALTEKDIEIRRVEAHFFSAAVEAARGLLACYKKEANQSLQPTAPGGRG
jgi:hypothetical protein